MAAKIAAATAGSSPLTRGTLTEYLSKWPASRFIPAYAGNSWFTVPLRMPRGSSPLTRGTRKVGPDELIRLRFIPAYAGNSQDTHLVRDLPSVHPRLRGELTIRISMVICTSGSSPLTRGTLNDSPYKALTRTVHPRLRGELFIVGVNVKSRVGSSPLTRGTPKRGAPVSGSGRFIPAYAGNSKNCG